MAAVAGSHPLSFAAGAGASGETGVAGSVTVNVIQETTHATIGDHDVGKVGLFSGHGNMALASWQRVTETLRIEPFWRVQLGKYILLGLTSSLLALPLYHADLLPGDQGSAATETAVSASISTPVL